MLFPILLFVSLLSFSNSQCTDDSDESCERAGNCTYCINQYSDLDSYVINNKTLLRTITAAIFVTGKGPSAYVKLNYNFWSCAQGNDTVLENEDINCTSHQTTYIWSESVLYLLGPRPLHFLTLFAVNVSSVSLSVQLPCLCSEVQFDLLARLTYLVCKFSNRKKYCRMGCT